MALSPGLGTSYSPSDPQQEDRAAGHADSAGVADSLAPSPARAWGPVRRGRGSSSRRAGQYRPAPNVTGLGRPPAGRRAGRCLRCRGRRSSGRARCRACRPRSRRRGSRSRMPPGVHRATVPGVAAVSAGTGAAAGRCRRQARRRCRLMRRSSSGAWRSGRRSRVRPKAGRDRWGTVERPTNARILGPRYQMAKKKATAKASQTARRHAGACRRRGPDGRGRLASIADAGPADAVADAPERVAAGAGRVAAVSGLVDRSRRPVSGANRLQGAERIYLSGSRRFYWRRIRARSTSRAMRASGDGRSSPG